MSILSSPKILEPVDWIWNRTIRAMISENSTRKTQARAFSFFAFTNNLGISIGPLVGRSCLKARCG